MSNSIALTFTARSSNAKTGPIPVSTSAKASCPECPFAGNGCYAEQGPLGALWAGLSRTLPGESFVNGRGTVRTMDWAGLTKSVRALYPTTLWRHNQAGDLPHTGGTIDAGMVGALVTANTGKRGFTYTHHNTLQNAANRETVRAANAGGFTVNLSGNTLAHADQLAAQNVAPVVAVLPASLERPSAKGQWLESAEAYRARVANLRTPAGRRVVVCPATYRDDVTCASCKLCAVASRTSIVGFPAHGARKKAASAVSAA
jgi:hypothetical protein